MHLGGILVFRFDYVEAGSGGSPSRHRRLPFLEIGRLEAGRDLFALK